MAATHKIEVFKSFSGENWGNVYLVDNITNLLSLTPIANYIVAAERAFHADTVLFEYARISTVEPNDNQYTTVPIGLAGERLVPDLVPLFVTLRVDILVNGGGRPSRKYYRGVLGEGDITATTVDAGILGDAVTALLGAMDSTELDGAALADPQGQKWVTPTGYPKPQMRQLHRRRRKAVPL